MFTDNAYVTILMCSHLGVKNGNFRPYTALQWSELGQKIVNSNVGEPANLLNMDKVSIINNIKISDEEGDRIVNLLSRGANLAFMLEEMGRKGVSIVTRSDKKYPQKLKSILKKHSPPLLYYCGNLSLANKTGIGIVGSRNIDEEGANFAQLLAKKAADENLVVFSGGAKGVDTISESTALNNNGYVVSILADSLDRKIKNKDVRDNIRSGKQLLISANNPDAPFSAASAMNRNKYIYALSNGTFVVASDYNKGGTWAGAVENIKNEWVNTFVWNNKKYMGNSELIKKGAIAVDNINNVSIIDLISRKIEKADQINIFELDKNVEVSIEKENIINENDTEYIKSDFDVYNTIVDLFLDFLKEPKTVEDITASLNITKSQATAWINRALSEGKINRVNKPVRYIVNE
ncbi:MAG: DNA-processing protein DprA [Sedimentibacter sp.]|uniref:DNA-processing protein DprA n=1 Tax=Sedimentibacter sp. TaxID=1960295 RepID=UPI0029823461|nr:DNA-processing protein DprA [Sedimentibacter sp.]MDW5298528.1 DNA-processing protein DprA [Sedimentibacter sp.]